MSNYEAWLSRMSDAEDEYPTITAAGLAADAGFIHKEDTMDYAPITTEEQEQLANWFTYHKPTEDQLPKYEQLRRQAGIFAETVMLNVPPCADRTVALRKIREAVMTANQAIACGGK